MSFQIILPGADFSGLGYPKVRRQIAGFDTDHLHALYLFENLSDGDPITQALDVSGHDRHGTLMTGSVAPTKRSQGAETTASPFLFSVPDLVFGSVAFSCVTVARTLIVPGTGGPLPYLWASTAEVTNVGASHAPTESVSQDVGAGNAPGSGHWGWYSNPGFTSAAIARVGATNPGATKNDFMAFAWSYNPATNTAVVASSGGSTTMAVVADSAAFREAKGGQHAFGLSRYSTASAPAPGDLALAAIYSEALPAAGLVALLAAARTRVALRGETVF